MVMLVFVHYYISIISVFLYLAVWIYSTNSCSWQCSRCLETCLLLMMYFFVRHYNNSVEDCYCALSTRCSTLLRFRQLCAFSSSVFFFFFTAFPSASFLILHIEKVCSPLPPHLASFFFFFIFIPFNFSFLYQHFLSVSLPLFYSVNCCLFLVDYLLFTYII